MSTWASRRLSNCQPLRNSSRSRPLNDSIQSFCHGEPDEDRPDAVEPAPVGHRVGDELRAVVEAHERRRASREHEPVEGGDHLVGVDGAVHDDGGALAGVLVDDVQQLEEPAVDGGVELEVERPQGVGGDGAHGSDRGADHAVGLLALPIRHLQALLTPQALDPLVVGLPALPAGGLGRPAPTPSRPFGGERPQERSQLGLVVRWRWRVEALGLPRQGQVPARRGGAAIGGYIRYLCDATGGGARWRYS